MAATVKDLLNIMQVRLSNQEEGLTRPHLAVAKATTQLVERLAAIPPNEQIEIDYASDPLRARYIRQSTGELLAEVHQRDKA
jgi:hypothetical protein